MKIAEGVVFPVPEKFEKTVNGKQVSLFTLENQNGMKAAITNYGGKVVSLLVGPTGTVYLMMW
jgi:aldose 1-epimerase